MDQVINHVGGAIQDFISEDAAILRSGRINGARFLRISEEQLVTDGMARGPASDIANYLERIKGTYFSRERAFYASSTRLC